MLFTTLVFSVIAALAASAQALDVDSCSAGAILGIYGVCGTNPVECGSDKCCLSGQTCVTGSAISCADSALQTGTTLTVSAGCYGTATGSASITSSGSSTGKATTPSNPATIATPTGQVTQTGAGGSASGSGSKGPTASSSKGPVPTGPGGFVSAPYTFTNGTGSPSDIATGTGKTKPTTTGVAQSNGAASAFTSPQNSVAVLLSAVAVAMFWL